MKKYYYDVPTFKLWRGSWSPTFKFWRGSWSPTFKLWGGPGSKVPESRGPGSGFLVPIFHHAVSYGKDLIIQICIFIKKRLQHRCFLWLLRIVKGTILNNICERLLLKIYPVLLFWLRRYFRSSSLSAFYKIGVLKTSVNS